MAAIIKYIEEIEVPSPWKIIITSQPQEWARIQMAILAQGTSSTDWKTVEIENPTFDELAPVFQEFPALRVLTSRKGLSEFVMRPKILDVAARQVAVGSIPEQSLIGETNFIEWIWEFEVLQKAHAAAREALLIRLGELQGDLLFTSTPTSSFSPSDLQLVDELKLDRLCLLEKGRLMFAHDLYGDWARLRALVANENNFESYISNRLDSPLWHRAIRLFGLYLIENDQNLERWRVILRSSSKVDAHSELITDLFLEAIIHATNTHEILEKTYDDLMAESGRLLIRLLNRFLHVATFPNPMMLKIGRALAVESDSQIASMNRVPYASYWVMIILFLNKHMEDVIDFIPGQLADIAQKWLSSSNEWPLRKEAAEIALSVGWHIYKLKRASRRWSGQEFDKPVYRAAIMAVYEKPESAIEFVRVLAGRVMPPIIEINEPQENIRTDLPRELFISSFYDEEVDVAAWPNGPSWGVDDTFRAICLDEPATLLPFMITHPETAREVILALSIKVRGRRIRYSSHDRFEERCGLERRFGWYTQGPYLSFLIANPEHGLDTIIRLANFVADRWVDYVRSQGGEPYHVSVTISGQERRYWGYANLYYTYRDSQEMPDMIVSAVMALEKWLYDRIEKEESIDDIVETVLEKSISLVLIGPLVSLGKKSPVLFFKALKPLLSVPEFFQWDLHHQVQGENHQLIGWGMQHTQQEIERAREWHTPPYRKMELEQPVLHFFLNEPEFRADMVKIRSKWIERLNRNDPNDAVLGHLERLIRDFNYDNWKVIKGYEGKEVWDFQPPEEFRQEQSQAFEKLKAHQMFTHIPIRCRQVLDKKIAPDEAEAVRLWAMIRSNEFAQSPDEAEEGLFNIESVLAGAIAVLLRFNKEWLLQDPQKLAWCKKKLLHMIENPPASMRFDTPESVGDWRWDSFCAEALPDLWVMEPESPEVRRGIARLAFAYHYSTAQILCRRSADWRVELGDDFLRLLNLVFNWSALRFQLNGLQFGINDKEKSIIQNKIESQLDQLALQFEDCSLPAEFPYDWKDYLIEEEYPRLVGPEEKYPVRHIRAFDLALVQAAFSWMPGINKAISVHEGETWVEFWREALNCSLWKATEDKSHGYHGPKNFDQWVFESIPDLILNLQSEEGRTDFWLPIIKLGADAHHWVEVFLFEWVLRDVDDAGSDFYLQIWQEMIRFALDNKKWSYSSNRSCWDLDGLWCKLIGIEFLSIWDESRVPIVENMEGCFEAWATHCLHRPKCMSSYLAFLKKPAALSLRVKSILWIANIIEIHADEILDDRHENIPDQLATLLDICWRQSASEIKRNTKAFQAFRNLLRILVERQNPIALEISDCVK